jgi:hypothetical protein
MCDMKTLNFTDIRRLALAITLTALAASGCDPRADAEREPPTRSVEAPPETEVIAAVAALSAEATATRDRILEVARSGSQRQLARLAGEFEGFQSNFGGSEHFAYWYSRRRMGSDPNEAIVALFDEPYAVREVGEEVWYIWPDLATLDPRGFALEKLSFRDRARLEELIGERGIEVLLRGEPYPGYRTAITSGGRWVYFVDGN